MEQKKPSISGRSIVDYVVSQAKIFGMGLVIGLIAEGVVHALRQHWNDTKKKDVAKVDDSGDEEVAAEAGNSGDKIAGDLGAANGGQ